MIGASRLYESTGQDKDSTIASFFWNTVIKHHTYVNGGNSNYEYFHTADSLSRQLSANTTETCNTYNMLKLTRHLFSWNPSAQWEDYYERALYNHILASKNHSNGMMCYYVPLLAGSKKVFGTPVSSFWCCTGTGMENHVKYGESIYAKCEDGSLYINLFIPSKLNWKERNLQIVLETTFPKSDKVVLKIGGSGNPAKFPINIRYPYWATNGITVSVNENPVIVKKDSEGYYTLQRIWKPGDKINIIMPMKIHAEGMLDNKNRIALLYGPIVLSGELGKEKPEQQNIPVFVSDDADASELIKPVSNTDTIMFQTSGTNNNESFSLIPFYEMHHQHYTVYWDKFTSAGWNEKKKEYETELKRQEDIKARTVDMIRIGEMQSERNHNFKGKKTNTGEAFGRKWRDASVDGWFSFTLDTKHSKDLQLVCTYWGSDNGNRSFIILIDDVKIASQKLESEKPNQFFDVYYDIPDNLVEGKQQITVKFQAQPCKMASGLFGCSLLKKKQ